MKLTPELSEVIHSSKGKDIEVSYRNGNKMTGFIQGSFQDPDGIIIHKHKWSKEENPLVRASLNDLRELRIESDVYH